MNTEVATSIQDLWQIERFGIPAIGFVLTGLGMITIIILLLYLYYQTGLGVTPILSGKYLTIAVVGLPVLASIFITLWGIAPKQTEVATLGITVPVMLYMFVRVIGAQFG